MSSPDYLSYKKKKQKMETGKSTSISRRDMVLRIFLITFVIIFSVVAFTIKNYSSRLDIEMASETGYGDNFDDSMRSSVDERLRQLQLEENLPSVSKSTKKKSEMDEIMDSASFEEIVQPNRLAVEEEVNTDEITLQDDSPASVKQVHLNNQNIRPVSTTRPPAPPKPAVNTRVKPPFETQELNQPPLPSEL